MKKVIIIVDESVSREQIDNMREAVLDPKKVVLIASESFIKNVYEVDFEDTEILTEK